MCSIKSVWKLILGILSSSNVQPRQSSIFSSTHIWLQMHAWNDPATSEHRLEHVQVVRLQIEPMPALTCHASTSYWNVTCSDFMVLAFCFKSMS